jgi:hypothetical protein
MWSKNDIGLSLLNGSARLFFTARIEGVFSIQMILPILFIFVFYFPPLPRAEGIPTSG